jgi:hypothetical protein
LASLAEKSFLFFGASSAKILANRRSGYSKVYAGDNDWSTMLRPYNTCLIFQ